MPGAASTVHFWRTLSLYAQQRATLSISGSLTSPSDNNAWCTWPHYRRGEKMVHAKFGMAKFGAGKICHWFLNNTGNFGTKFQIDSVPVVVV